MVGAEFDGEVRDHRNCNTPTCLEIEASRGMIATKCR